MNDPGNQVENGVFNVVSECMRKCDKGNGYIGCWTPTTLSADFFWYLRE